MALYGYARVSTGRQVTEGDSLEAQSHRIAAYAFDLKVDVEEMYVEAGVSGSVPLGDRPQGSALLARLRKGDIVVSAKLDRMFRSASDALSTAEAFKDQGVSLVLRDLGGDVTSNGVSKLFFTILAAVADFERGRIGERQLDAKADAARRGVYRGGKVPYGYAVAVGGVLEPVAGEQAALATMRRLRASGAPLRTIAAEVEAQAGRRLSLTTIARLLADTPTPVD